MATINYHPHRAQLGFLRDYLTQIHRFKADIPTVNHPPPRPSSLAGPGPCSELGRWEGHVCTGPVVAPQCRRQGPSYRKEASQGCEGLSRTPKATLEPLDPLLGGLSSA